MSHSFVVSIMKLFVVLLTLTALIATVFAAPTKTELAALLTKHGRNPMSVSRIVGGNPAGYGQIPYIVSMEWYGFHICGGIIISVSRILTAQHCTESDPPELFGIRAGSLYIEFGGQLNQVSFINEHAGYDPYTLENDIAVMHLTTPLDVSFLGVAVIGMPVQGAGVAVGTPATVSGWGTTTEDGYISEHKRYVTVPIISNALCNQLNFGGIAPGMICAAVLEGGYDACQGDSGGPLTAGSVVIGIVSWGYGCARPNLPGVYTDVAFFRNWIDSN